MSKVILMASILFCALLTVSCARSEQEERTTFSDSAGVILAVSDLPAWGPGDAWHVSDEPILEIGAMDGPEEYLFSDLVGAVRLTDGRIVVGDRGSADLRFYAPTGEFLSRSGGQGEGPGEFQRLDFIGVLPGDSLVTFDGRLLRVQLFDPSGQFLQSVPVEASWPHFLPEVMVGPLGEHRVAVVLGGFGTEVPTGIVRWPPEMVVAVDIATGAMDSLLVVQGPEASVSRGEAGIFHGKVVFGKGNEFATTQGTIAVIDTEVFEVQLFSASGQLERIVRAPRLPQPVTEADVEEYVQIGFRKVREMGMDPSPEDQRTFRQRWEGYARASTLPLLHSVYVDLEGNFWLEQFFQTEAPPALFDVFSRDGIWLGEVSLPPGHHRGSRPRLGPSFQIGDDYVLGVWTDEMDVQYVRMYELHK